MKVALALALAAAGLAGCRVDSSQPPVDAAALVDDGGPSELSGEGYEGAFLAAAQAPWIVGAAEREWQPTPDDVRALERNLRVELERVQADPHSVDPYATAESRRAFVRREVGEILERLPSYRRQYIGVIDSTGRKTIFINAFPGPTWPEGATFDFSSWRDQFIAVSDGGFWYWQARYDVEARRLIAFDSNGYA